MGHGSLVIGAQLQNLGKFVYPILPRCLSDEALKAIGPFYLVYMPGEVKYPKPFFPCSLCGTSATEVALKLKPLKTQNCFTRMNSLNLSLIIFWKKVTDYVSTFLRRSMSYLSSGIQLLVHFFAINLQHCQYSSKLGFIV